MITVSEWVVIHLESDTDRADAFQKEIPFRFFPAVREEQGELGCLKSHLLVLQEAVAQNVNHVAIMEDDAEWSTGAQLLQFPCPAHWEMIYLGGVLQYEYDHGNPLQKANVLSTHAYIVHRDIIPTIIHDLLQIVTGEWPFMAIDQYYVMFIHPRQQSYLHNPILVGQRAGYSHIQQTLVNYNLISHQDIQPLEYELCEPVAVTIVTPTKQRSSYLKHLTLFCILAQQYPMELIQWIIVDEYEYDQKPPTKLTHPVLQILHLLLQKQKDSPNITIAQKRNVGAKVAASAFIVHMDDDDYYPPFSLHNRVSALQNSPCIGCTDMNTYHIYNDISQYLQQRTMFEASMAYTKAFWHEMPFEDRMSKGEGYSFLFGRAQKCRSIPVREVMIALQHHNNITGNLRNQKTDSNGPSFWVEFPNRIQTFFQLLRKYVSL